MTNWKKSVHKILAFLLVFGFICGMMDHLRVTAAASQTEGGKLSGTEIGTAEGESVEPEESGDKSGDMGSGDTESEDPNTKKPADSSADLDFAQVEELIKALPTLEELKAFDQEALKEAYEQIQKAFDVYESLDDSQKAMLPGAKEQLNELLEYFTTLIMPLTATDEDIKNAREAMTRAMVNWEKEVDLSAYNLTVDDWGKIWPDVAQDNPDLFYVLDGTYYTSQPAGTVQKCVFTYNPQYDQSSVVEYKAAIDKVFAEVIDGNMTDEQKATALHDYLVQHMVYDQNANNNLGVEKRNAYEALVNGIGVCQGYTLAYAALLDKAGIEAELCKSRSMNHIWNYVRLNGNWYHADLTYDDATSASQTGETGYVKHDYFLLSDTAIQNMAEPNKSHTWDANSITCTDTSYDNSWHKTAPIKESAIYAVDGSSYYLKKETAVNADICLGASLIKRDVNGTEIQIGSYEIENLGPGWPMYQMSFSRLSCSRGILYFNVGNAVYAFDPSVDAEPVKIYRYEDQSGRIVTGLLAEGNKMTLEISSQTGKIEEKIVVSTTGGEVQEEFGFAEDTKTVTYGDTEFTMTAQGAAAGASISYSSSDPSVASVDPASGLVRILKAGSTVITATASAVGNYTEAESTCKLTVSPKALAWDVSALEAADRLDFIKDQKATLYGELRVQGILEKDAKEVLFDCPADKLSGVYETVAEGSQKVTLSWKSAQDEVTLEGNGRENYIMPAALPEITGRISVSEEFPQEPADGNEFKIEVESGITKVPDSFQNKEHLNTPDKIEQEMKLKIQEKDNGITDTNMVVYDVELLVNINGAGWEKVTKDNFPSEGLAITLPYPSNTGRNTHDFVVTHMFTEDMNGFLAGDVEYPTVDKTEKGISFKVNGLSPIAVGWKEVDSGSSGGSGDGNGSGSGSGSSDGNGNGGSGGSGSGSSGNGGVSSGSGSGGSNGNGSSSAPNTSTVSGTQNSPLTGDASPIMPYVLLAAGAFSVMLGIFIRKKINR